MELSSSQRGRFLMTAFLQVPSESQSDTVLPTLSESAYDGHSLFEKNLQT